MFKKGCFIVLLYMIAAIQVFAQEKKKEEVVYPLDWHTRSFAEDGVYGAEICGAYDYLKDRQPKRKVVVAVIDAGIDPGHEDLRGNLWVNRNEIPGNGIDDDGNGYTDDVHGWNFLGLPDGKQVEELSLESDREFLRLREKFEDVDTNRLSKKEMELYRFYDKKVAIASPVGNAYRGIEVSRLLVAYAEEFDREMRAKFPGVKLTKEHFASIMNKDEKNEMRVQAHFFYMLGWSRTSQASWEDIFKVRLQLVGNAEKRYEQASRVEMNQRESIGDDLDDVGDRHYGNNNLKAKNSNHGTHVAGIIGATRGNGIGMDGIADVELMVLRVSAGKGDEYDKDVANAIRYAVENGANIINMSFGKSFSPQKAWVDEAMRFAEKKGVLLVHAAGNDGECIDENPVYPTRELKKKKVLRNFITVGSIDLKGMPAVSSNYGKKNVDLFAPGVDIYSTVMDGNYKKMGGTSMAAPVVSGIAALVWNYYPELTVKQLKQVLMEGVTPLGEVLKPQSRTSTTKQTPVEFRELCVSGGIVNAMKAVQLAEKLVNKK